MAIYRKGRRWVTDWYDRAGRRHRKFHRTRDQAQKVDRAIKRWKRHEGPKPKGYTLRGMLEAWIGTCTHLAASTQEQYRNATKHMLLEIRPNKSTTNISPADLMAVRARLSRHSRDAKYRDISIIRRALNWAWATGLLTTHPDELCPPARYKRHRRTVTLDPLLAARMKAAANPTQSYVLHMGYRAGSQRPCFGV